MTKKHCIEARWAFVTSIVWVMCISIATFIVDKIHPGDYLILAAIICVCGTLLPWCFIDADTLP